MTIYLKSETMINFFLKAKHWQIFLLTMGLPMIGYFIMMAQMFSNIAGQSEPDPTAMFSTLPWFMFTMVLFSFFFYAWFWSIGVGLNKLIPNELGLKVSRFKAFMIFPIVYIFLFLTYFAISFMSMASAFSDPTQMEAAPLFNPFLIVLIIPLHLFAMFCMFHNLYFVAKTLKTAELRRKVSFSDYAGEFFLFWFYPIGVWFLQPTVNRLWLSEPDDPTLESLVGA